MDLGESLWVLDRNKIMELSESSRVWFGSHPRCNFGCLGCVEHVGLVRHVGWVGCRAGVHAEYRMMSFGKIGARKRPCFGVWQQGRAKRVCDQACRCILVASMHVLA